MGAFLIKGLIKVLRSMLVTIASEYMIKYALFAIADAAVKSTKTEKDDQWLAEFKEQYEQS
jgi:hypothetical protein